MRNKGEGSISYNKNKKLYVGQFDAGYYPDGRRRRRTIYGKTKHEVVEKLKACISDFKNQALVDKSSVTLSQLCHRNIDEEYALHVIQATSYLRKKHTAGIIDRLAFAHLPIQSVTPALINSSLQPVTSYANSVISKVMGLLNATFQSALVLGIVSNNPFTIRGAIKRPRSVKPDKKITALSVDEQRRFLAVLQNSKDPYKDVFLIALYTGMRIGEILALGEGDVSDGFIHVSKTLTKNEKGEAVLNHQTKTYAGMRDIPFLPVLNSVFDNLSR